MKIIYYIQNNTFYQTSFELPKGARLATESEIEAVQKYDAEYEHNRQIERSRAYENYKKETHMPSGFELEYDQESAHGGIKYRVISDEKYYIIQSRDENFGGDYAFKNRKTLTQEEWKNFYDRNLSDPYRRDDPAIITDMLA